MCTFESLRSFFILMFVGCGMLVCYSAAWHFYGHAEWQWFLVVGVAMTFILVNLKSIEAGKPIWPWNNS